MSKYSNKRPGYCENKNYSTLLVIVLEKGMLIIFCINTCRYFKYFFSNCTMNTFKSILPNNDYGFVAGESASATLSVCVCLSLCVCHKSDQFYRNGSTDQTSWGLARRHQILRPSLPCILKKSRHLQNNGISFWNFGLRKFRHGTSIIVACGQLSWKQVDAQCDKRSWSN